MASIRHPDVRFVVEIRIKQWLAVWVKKKIFFVPILLAAAAYAGWRFYQDKSELPANAITLYGNIDLRQVDLAFLPSERIAEVLVDEGDVVAAGQRVATLETVRLRQAVDEAQSMADAMKENYEKVKAGPRVEEIAQARAEVEAAQSKLVNARIRSKRLTALASDRAVSRQDADDAVAEEQVAAANLQVSEKQLQLLLAGSRKEDIAAALAQFRQATAALEIKKQNLNDAVLVSPCAGVVRTRILESGDMASPQRAVYNIALTQTKWVRAWLSESQLGKVQPGFAARVSNDSFPGESFQGKVGFISPVAEFTPKNVETPDLRTNLVYEVRVIVEDPRNQLRLGAPATVVIPLDQPVVLPDPQTTPARAMSPETATPPTSGQ